MIVLKYLMVEWTEKYRPTSLNEIIGNKRSISDLKLWAETWVNNNPKFKAIILLGKPGIGKTSAAISLANDYNWSYLELNTSDSRNALRIKNIATVGAMNETFNNNGFFLSTNSGGRKLIILDEADNLYERNIKNNSNDLSDKGGKKAIIDTIKITKQPIILIVNNYYDLIKGSGEILKKLCKTIRFYPPYPILIFNMLKKISINQEIDIDDEVLKIISERCKGDVRSAINDFQSISYDKKFIDIKSLNVLGYRDREKIIFDALREIFKTKDVKNIRHNISNLNEDPNILLLWLNQNVYNEYKKIGDLVKAYDSISLADTFLAKTYRRQYYGFWSYASEIMCGGVANAKSYNYHNEKYEFPVWLRKIKLKKSNLVFLNSILNKLSKKCHISNYKTKLHILDYFKDLCKNNPEVAIKFKESLQLTDEEIIFLLENNSKKIDYVLNANVKKFKKSDENKKVIEKEINLKKLDMQYSLNDF
jgi:replication factor C large subunit